jgi:hypothetical protein
MGIVLAAMTSSQHSGILDDYGVTLQKARNERGNVGIATWYQDLTGSGV